MCYEIEIAATGDAAGFCLDWHVCEGGKARTAFIYEARSMTLTVLCAAIGGFTAELWRALRSFRPCP